MRPRRPAGPALVIVASLLVVAVSLGAYALAATHQVLPGVRGCEMIRSTPAQSGCIERQLAGAMAGETSKVGLDAVEKMAAESPLVQSHCHLAMHPIGERAGERAASRGTMPPAANGTSTCRQGFMHGMMLGFVSSVGDGDISQSLPQLCSREGLDENNCAHVVGHLIARGGAEEQGQAERDVAEGCTVQQVASDTAVDRAAVSESDERECIRGGYMEIALTAKQPPLAQWRDRCASAPERGREECFAWLPAIASYRKQASTDAAAQCARLEAKSTTRADCVAGVARLIAGRAPCRSFANVADRSACQLRSSQSR